MTILINLKNIDSKYNEQLLTFFTEQSKQGIKVWKKNTPYFFTNGTEFCFTHNVFENERKNGRAGVRYQVISNVYEFALMPRQQSNREKNTVYFKLDSSPVIQYEVIGPDKKLKQGTLDLTAIEDLKIPAKITLDWLKEKKIRKTILSILSEKTHTAKDKGIIGEGGFGQFVKIKGRVDFDAQAPQFKTKEKPEGATKDLKRKRAVKIQIHSNNNPLSTLEKEYTLTKRTPHLGIKKPTLNHTANSDTSYTLMKIMPGKTLFDIINENTLSVAQRLDLSKALIHALKEQVTQYNIVHRDLKPDNIMVHMGPPVRVNIIDFGLSMDQGIPDGRVCGTTGYYAPEVMKDSWAVNKKADVFSMARVIALLWNVDTETYEGGPLATIRYETAKKPEQLLYDLFSNLNVDNKTKKLIKKTLVGMLEVNPKKRFSIDEAIGCIEQVKGPSKTSFFAEKSKHIFKEIKDAFHTKPRL